MERLGTRRSFSKVFREWSGCNSSLPAACDEKAPPPGSEVVMTWSAGTPTSSATRGTPTRGDQECATWLERVAREQNPAARVWVECPLEHMRRFLIQFGRGRTGSLAPVGAVCRLRGQWKGAPGCTTRTCWIVRVRFCTLTSWIGAARPLCWADCLPIFLERHSDVARLLVGQLENPTTPCLQARRQGPYWSGRGGGREGVVHLSWRVEDLQPALC